MSLFLAQLFSYQYSFPVNHTPLYYTMWFRIVCHSNKSLYWHVAIAHVVFSLRTHLDAFPNRLVFRQLSYQYIQERHLKLVFSHWKSCNFKWNIECLTIINYEYLPSGLSNFTVLSQVRKRYAILSRKGIFYIC